MNLEVIFEDNHLLVVKKPQNIPVQEDSSGDPDFLNICKEYIKEKYSKQGNVFLGLVHRLDRPTGGVMVFAKTSKCASRLSEQIREGLMEKNYLAVCIGTPKNSTDTLKNYLKKNEITNTVYVANVGVEGSKYAELSYKTLESTSNVSLLKVALATGRGHQIRVQLSNIGNPVFGDVRYGGDIAKGYNLALWACTLRFYHPITNKTMTFFCFPPADQEPWKRFDIERHMKVF